MPSFIWLMDFFLRKGRDSNSWYGYPYDSLANCWFQPLTHPSPRRSVLGHVMSEMLFFESACKGTTKNAHVQIFLEKNAFLDKKSAHGLHFTRFFAYHSVCHLVALSPYEKFLLFFFTGYYSAINTMPSPRGTGQRALLLLILLIAYCSYRRDIPCNRDSCISIT